MNNDEADLRRRAEAGDIAAQFELANWLKFGMPSAREEGQQWLRRAADGGHTEARFECARSVPSNTPERAQSVRVFQELAAQGHVGAMEGLGYAYVNGSGITADIAQGRYWMEQAAEKGDAKTQNDIAGMFLEHPALKDPSAALRLFLLAAERGNRNSMLWLGRMYKRGEGVAPDLERARQYFIMVASTAPFPEEVEGLMALQNLGIPTDVGRKLLTDTKDTAARVSRLVGFLEELDKRAVQRSGCMLPLVAGLTTIAAAGTQLLS